MTQWKSTTEGSKVRTRTFALPAVLIALAAMGVAGCGSSSKSSSSGSSGGTQSTPVNTGGKMGGAVTDLEVAGGIDSLDPGYWYYQTDYEDIGQTTQRTLYGFRPQDTTPQPDLATALPTVTDGGKTLTFHIRSGVHYSAPLASRTVTADDIKYGMERCFSANVGNGYAFSYYVNIVGVPSKPAPTPPEVSGIQAPNATTLVIKTKVPVGVLAVPNALGLYCTTPVPKDYAAKYDKGSQSTYGNHEVFVGPYMIKGAGTGTVPSSGYQTGKLLALVRNPSWVRSTDPIRPAYFDSITFKGGNDITVASRQILAGQSLLSGDFAAPPTSILKAALEGPQKSQFHISPSGGNRYVALNTTIKPLDNENFRKAIAAVLNRNALRLTRGGPAIGLLATHFIPPGMPGFQEAGGMAGDPANDFYANPNGNVALAESYMKKAGYPSGKYTGPPLFAVGDNQVPAKNTVEAFQQQVSQIGIRLQLREIPRATLLSKYCTVPKAMVAICPTLGWGKDFFDSQSMITPVFYGPNIVPSGNINTAQVNDPGLNKQMLADEQLIDPTARANAWAQLDKEITSKAYVVMFLWDNEVSFASSNVHGVTWPFNGNTFDLTATSLK
jgi:peptide/nickel transport system substrate-binding protein